MPRLLYVIPDTDMKNYQAGLVRHLSERGIDFKNLKNGDVVAFLNRKETILRVLAVLPEKNTLGFVGTYKSPHGRVPLDAIQYITQCMGGHGFNMNRAIKMSLEKLLGGRRVRGESKRKAKANGARSGNGAKPSAIETRASGN